MIDPNAQLSAKTIREVEDQLMRLCSEAKTIDDLQIAHPLWEWAANSTGRTVAELRQEIESHETDEKFDTEFLEEKDHLLKLPLILLSHINS